MFKLITSTLLFTSITSTFIMKNSNFLEKTCPKTTLTHYPSCIESQLIGIMPNVYKSGIPYTLFEEQEIDCNADVAIKDDGALFCNANGINNMHAESSYLKSVSNIKQEYLKPVPTNNVIAPAITDALKQIELESIKPASRMNRIFALLIDGISTIILALLIIVPISFLVNRKFQGGVFAVFAPFVYDAFFYFYQEGETLGKQLFDLKLIDINTGNRPSYHTMVIRRFGFILNPFFLDFCVAFFNDHDRCLHDYISNTRVVSASKF